MSIAINIILVLSCVWLIKTFLKRNRKDLAVIVGVFYLAIISCWVTYLVFSTGFSIGNFISTLK